MLAAACGFGIARDRLDRLPARLALLTRAGALAAALAAAWTTLASLAATWWVYDAGELRWWRFPARVAGVEPRRILLVTAGFDEVCVPLAAAHPRAEVTVVDILDDARAVEASIRRARRLYPADAARVSPGDLAGGARYDLVLFAQSLHELRRHADRLSALSAALRCLEPGGAVVLVEHLRNAVNVLAYGPGAWHFHSGRAWRAAIRDSGGGIARRERIGGLVEAWVIGSAA